MAKNYIFSGSVLDDLVAPAGGVEAGKGYLIGALFVIALISAAEDEVFTGQLDGAWELDAASHASNQVIDQGGPVYYDATEDRCTNVATGNILIGAAIADKASTDTSVRVKLWPRGAAPEAAITPVATTGASNTTPYGYTTQAQANAIPTAINSIIAALGKHGIVVPG